MELTRLNGVFVGQKRLINTEIITLNYLPKEDKKYLVSKNNPLEISPITLANTQINNHQNPKNPDLSQPLLTTKESINDNLDTIRNLADAGKLTEAVSKCQSYLYDNSTNAEAYVLLGQVYQAQRLELEAEKCFQKAIYLDPKNSEALLHLTLLREEKGDIATANILRQRWQRLHKL